jgi:hypothetical protein
MPKSATKRAHRESADQLCAAARASFDRLYGREISDDEWVAAGGRVLDLFALLARWQELHARSDSLRDNTSSGPLRRLRE